MAWTRRGILKVGLGGGALLALGGAGLSLWPSRLQDPRTPLGTMSPLEFSVIAAACEAIVPASDRFPSAWSLQVPELVDRYLSLLHPGDAEEFCSALRLLENGFAGLLLDGRPMPFTRASVAQRQATLESWRGSMIPLRRTAFRAIHKLVVSTYYGHPGVYSAIGYGIPVGLAGGGRP